MALKTKSVHIQCILKFHFYGQDESVLNIYNFTVILFTAIALIVHEDNMINIMCTPGQLISYLFHGKSMIYVLETFYSCNLNILSTCNEKQEDYIYVSLVVIYFMHFRNAVWLFSTLNFKASTHLDTYLKFISFITQ